MPAAPNERSTPRTAHRDHRPADHQHTEPPSQDLGSSEGAERR